VPAIVFQIQAHSSYLVVVWNSSCIQQQLHLTFSVQVLQSLVPSQGLNLNVLFVSFLHPPFLEPSSAKLALLEEAPSMLISGIPGFGLKIFYGELPIHFHKVFL
jgi:hypothetical protein